MKTYDIWETNKTVDRFKERPHFVNDNLVNRRKNGSLTSVNGRKGKGECVVVLNP
jgi:hypothetical protein